jgi:hypothetical protein
VNGGLVAALAAATMMALACLAAALAAGAGLLLGLVLYAVTGAIALVGFALLAGYRDELRARRRRAEGRPQAPKLASQPRARSG